MDIEEFRERIRECLQSDNCDWAFNTWLILSYAYYCLDVSLTSDDDYDALCKKLLAGWKGGWRPKGNLGYIDEECLTSGTAYHILASKYPGPARSVAVSYARQISNRLKIPPHEPDYHEGYSVFLKEHGGTFESNNKPSGLDRFFA